MNSPLMNRPLMNSPRTSFLSRKVYTWLKIIFSSALLRTYPSPLACPLAATLLSSHFYHLTYILLLESLSSSKFASFATTDIIWSSSFCSHPLHQALHATNYAYPLTLRHYLVCVRL